MMEKGVFLKLLYCPLPPLPYHCRKLGENRKIFKKKLKITYNPEPYGILPYFCVGYVLF